MAACVGVALATTLAATVVARRRGIDALARLG